MIYSRRRGVKDKMVDGLTEITASWKGGMAFVGQNATGGSVQMGSQEDLPGISPMQLLLVAIAGCTGMDIVSILQKKRADLADLQVRVSGHRADDHPKIWTGIHLRYVVWGQDIKTNDLVNAIELSKKKYCSVGIMLEKSANITSDYIILKPGESENM